MHQSSIRQLINRFNSPEREAWQKPSQVIDYFNLDSQYTVADIGAGSGYFTFPLANRTKKVIAIDLDQGFINYIDSQANYLKINNIETRVCTESSPNLNDNEVDVAVMVNTAHHINKKAKYFNRIRKGLKFGGVFHVIDFNQKEFEGGPKQEMKLKLNDLKKELALAGFIDIQVDTTLLNYQYIVSAK